MKDVLGNGTCVRHEKVFIETFKNYETRPSSVYGQMYEFVA